MNKPFLSVQLLFLSFYFSAAQNPLVKQWDKTYGGDNYEFNAYVIHTADGGLMAASSTFSGISGDVTEPGRGAEDYWMLKMDASGNKQWDKRFGADNYDRLLAIRQTADQGFILGGESNSVQNGDRSQPNWDPGAYPTQDYWIVKTDSAGNKQWDKRYGGTFYDLFSDLIITADGGYLLAGYSISDSSGDKTQNKRGGYDCWLVKIDAQGVKQWDKRYGTFGHDQWPLVRQTADGGYMVGMSIGGSGGDVTLPGYWSSDYWIMKTDGQGNKQWEKRYGTNASDWLGALTPTTDGGYMLLGSTSAGITGDKSEANHDPADTTNDIWIIKLDTAGNKQWDKSFGGIDDDFIGNNSSIYQTTDGGYFFIGHSYSPAGGDKSENNLGWVQIWMIKLNAAGNKQWDKTVLAPGITNFGYSFAVQNGCYTVASSISADTGGHKTQPAIGRNDIWIVKFCDTTYSSVNPVQPDKAEVLINPNPFADEVTFNLRKNNLNSAVFKITSVSGQTVFSKQENNLSDTYSKTLSLNFLPSGVYAAEVIIGDERIVKLLVKQ
ncbi:MAG: T9SS type A sorting domain-containing protein [Bacteroidota bacterium]